MKDAASRHDYLRIEPTRPAWHRVVRVSDPGGRLPSDPPFWEVADRETTDSVAVMLFVDETDDVVLVERFRAGPTVADPSHDGRILETIAAALPAGREDQAVAVAQDAVRAQTGYALSEDAFAFVASFYPSPGASSERVSLFFAAAEKALPEPKTHPQSESRSALNLQVRQMPLVQFLLLLEAREAAGSDAVDAKILLGAQALKDHLARRRGARDLNAIELDAPWEYALPDLEPKIVLHRGDVGDVHGVDVWVNSENTDFEMDQRMARSISGRIRALGAHIGSDREPLEDTIWLDLLRGRGRLSRGSVGDLVETTPGELKGRNGVNRLLHVAAVEASAFGIKYAKLGDISDCVKSALRRAETGRRILLLKSRGRSILFPMIGAGNGDRFVAEIFSLMLKAVREYFAERPPSGKRRLERVHFVAYTAGDFADALNVLERAGATPLGAFRAAEAAGADAAKADVAGGS